MTTQTQEDQDQVVYPHSDGKPIADSTLQFEWITKIQGNLAMMFREDPNVFVAADLFWYPVEGQPSIRAAPDTMAAFGRPKGHRLCYKQWEEGGVAPQVVFGIQSWLDTSDDLECKFRFYERHGVEEYYHYDPEAVVLSGWVRKKDRLSPIAVMADWTSPRLDVRFDLSGEELIVFRPDGQRFRTVAEWSDLLRAGIELDQIERVAREEAHRRAEVYRRQAGEARQRAERLAAMLRALGVDPDKPSE